MDINRIEKELKMSKITKRNWLLDAVLIISGITAILSGIYFLFLPSGGYRGGRNPAYDLQILFSRQTWDDLHTWGGIAMIAVAIFHLALHWSWVASMTKHAFKAWAGKSAKMNPRARWNLILNLVVGISFMLTALSGIYFLFVPGGRGAVDPLILFTRTTWDLIHTWAGVMFILGVSLHFAIHWKWVTKVSRMVFEHARPAQESPQTVASINS
jgi:hypothetical protein